MNQLGLWPRGKAFPKAAFSFNISIKPLFDRVDYVVENQSRLIQLSGSSYSGPIQR
jgi:hypothetical protein